ncbi:MAG: hypothetical protein R3E02_03225 [Blastomonas sp.]
MMKTILPHRPARAAIAAVLAFTATPVLAQDIAPLPAAPAPAPAASTTAPATTSPVPPPVFTPEPVRPAPAAPPPAAATPPAPMVGPATPVIAPAPVIERPAPVRITPVQEEAKAAPRPALQARETAAPVSSTAAAPDTAVANDETIADSAAMDAPAPAIDTPFAETAPVVANGEAATSAIDSPADIPEWAWLAGALALLGVGGGAYAAARRNRHPKKRIQPLVHTAANPGTRTTSDHPLTANERARAATAEPLPAMAMPTSAAMARPQEIRLTPDFDRKHYAAETQQPAPMAAQSVRPARLQGGNGRVMPFWEPVDRQLLEAMIAQPPSSTNPFRSRPNRKRRALFMLRHGMTQGNRPVTAETRQRSWIAEAAKLTETASSRRALSGA